MTIKEIESSDLDTFYEQQLEMLRLVVDRPIFARAASDNVASIRVLQKCDFKIIGKNKDFANGRGEDTDEYILRLDLEQANE